MDESKACSEFTVSGTDIASALGEIGTVFVCQQWVLDIFWSLPKHEIGTWRKVEHSAISITGILHVLIGIVGFFAFDRLKTAKADETEDNILNEFKKDNSSVIIDICRLSFSVSVLLSMPMQMFTCRSSFIHLCRDTFQGASKWESQNLSAQVFYSSTIGYVCLRI